jgi:lysyl-tRNA synthetase class 2
MPCVTFFNDAGYLEVETPVLQPIPGGCAAPLHHTSQLIRHSALYANSTIFKRLIVGGFDGVYEFSKT